MARPVDADRARSFPPLIGAAPRLLILGSLPGRASLSAGEYYAHPRNLFWDLIAEYTGVSRSMPYAQRGQALVARGIALWDVVQEARRPGSLDASIEFATARHNDITSLILAQTTLRAVAFNGATAARLFTRQVLPQLGERAATLHLLSLPSTSPAHASLSLTAKRAAWQRIADQLD